MYWQKRQTLVSSDDGPDLATTNAFDSLLDTLPDDCPIPMPIVKFGLLTKHVYLVSDDFRVDFDEEDIESAKTAVVPPETLSAIEYLLYHHSDHLPENKKKRIGQFCEATRLNRTNKLGASESAVREAVDESDDKKYPFLIRIKYSCEYCGEGFDSIAARNGHLTNCDQNPDVEGSGTDQSSSGERPAFGKEIRKDKGSERVAGRNPFADPERLKDTGLHQGGGS